MSEKKVTSIAEKSGDSRMWSARQCLQDLLDEIDAGTVKPEKLLVLLWEDVGAGHLKRSERYVNFTNVESIAFLAAAYHDAITNWKDPK